jgi:hypothetical protein
MAKRIGFRLIYIPFKRFKNTQVAKFGYGAEGMISGNGEMYIFVTK